MKDFKNQLLDLFCGKNPKSYPRLVYTKADLLEKVNEISTKLQTESLNETFWCIINEQSPPLCSCGEKKEFNSFTKGYWEFCKNVDKTCLAKKRNQSEKLKEFWKQNPLVKEQMMEKRTKTNIEKYGVENPLTAGIVKEKVKKTNLEKYGVEYTIFSPIVQEKIKKTINDRYGVDYPFQSKDVRKQADKTFLKNNPNLVDKMQLARNSFIQQYGRNPFSLDHIKQKSINTRLQKYGYSHATQKHLCQDTINILENAELFKQAIANRTIGEAAVLLGVNETTIVRRALLHKCRSDLVRSTRSKWEFKMTRELINLGLVENIDFIRSDRSILQGKELDFYFPKINAAIELGSVFYHSEISAGRGKYYHYKKWKLCEEQGIDLFQYWDFELDSKWDVVISKVKYLFGKINNSIGARKINKIEKISLDQERKFLEKNHIQGFSQNRMLALGAFFQDQLIAVLSLDFKLGDIEIIRYATDINGNYPGLFSKMIKASLTYIDGYQHKNIITISDNRHSNGALYSKSNFELLRSSSAEYYYTKNYHLIERKRRYTKDKIRKKFNIDVNNKTEWQLMQELGYDRIWDAGKQHWKIPVREFLK